MATQALINSFTLPQAAVAAQSGTTSVKGYDGTVYYLVPPGANKAPYWVAQKPGTSNYVPVSLNNAGKPTIGSGITFNNKTQFENAVSIAKSTAAAQQAATTAAINKAEATQATKPATPVAPTPATGAKSIAQINAEQQAFKEAVAAQAAADAKAAAEAKAAADAKAAQARAAADAKAAADKIAAERAAAARAEIERVAAEKAAADKIAAQEAAAAQAKAAAEAKAAEAERQAQARAAAEQASAERQAAERAIADKAAADAKAQADAQAAEQARAASFKAGRAYNDDLLKATSQADIDAIQARATAAGATLDQGYIDRANQQIQAQAHAGDNAAKLAAGTAQGVAESQQVAEARNAELAAQKAAQDQQQEYMAQLSRAQTVDQAQAIIDQAGDKLGLNAATVQGYVDQAQTRQDTAAQQAADAQAQAVYTKDFESKLPDPASMPNGATRYAEGGVTYTLMPTNQATGAVGQWIRTDANGQNTNLATGQTFGQNEYNQQLADVNKANQQVTYQQEAARAAAMRDAQTPSFSDFIQSDFGKLFTLAVIGSVVGPMIGDALASGATTADVAGAAAGMAESGATASEITTALQSAGVPAQAAATVAETATGIASGAMDVSALASSSGITAETIAMANATLDPIAALNAAQGWTTVDTAYLASIGAPAALITQAQATNVAAGLDPSGLRILSDAETAELMRNVNPDYVNSLQPMEPQPYRVEVSGAAGTAEAPGYAVTESMTPGSQLATQAQIDAGAATWNPAANAWEVNASPVFGEITQPIQNMVLTPGAVAPGIDLTVPALEEVVVTATRLGVSPETVMALGGAAAAMAALGGGAGAGTAATTAPVAPAPAPTPVETAPVTPAQPTPAPAPVETAPVTPAPVTPTPVETAPVTPAPVETAPVVSAPVTPAPVTPTPVETAPVATAPTTPAVEPPLSPVTPVEITPTPPVTPVEATTPIDTAPVAPAPVTPTPPANNLPPVEDAVATPNPNYTNPPAPTLPEAIVDYGKAVAEGMTAADLAKIAAGYVLINGVLTPPAPAKRSYGPVAPMDWGAGVPLDNSGLNPGYITNVPGQYQTNNMQQSRFYWGQKPYQAGTTFDPALYRSAPAAPAQPWGLQQMYNPQTQTIDNLLRGVGQASAVAPYNIPQAPRV